jgi:uncharacterized protein (DUF1330 family)
MPAYLVLDVAVQDSKAYEKYKELAPVAISAFGGRYLVRGGRTDTLEGDWRPSRLVILEFPTAEQARAWWASREYSPAKALRQACAHTDMVLVEGVPSGTP